MLDNFAFFSGLLMEVIGRCFQLDLTADPGTTLLYRVTKVSTCCWVHVHACSSSPVYQVEVLNLLLHVFVHVCVIWPSQLSCFGTYIICWVLPGKSAGSTCNM